MEKKFAQVLESAAVFRSITTDRAAASGGDAPRWRVILTAADYGEPNAYTFELQALVVRGDEPLTNYVSKQSARQARGQLTIGPAELAQLAERCIRDVVRQIAEDTPRLEGLR